MDYRVDIVKVSSMHNHNIEGAYLVCLYTVPIKTSTFYFFLNISVRNQPIFRTFDAHVINTLTISASLLI